MKVLHLFKDYYPPTPGGIEQLVHAIVHGLEGFEFAVLTGSRSGREVVEEDEGVPVVRARELLRVSTAPVALGWARWIRRLEPDVLHVHMPVPTAELAVLASRTPARIVASFHAEIVRFVALRPAYRAFLRHFWRRADTVLVASPPLLATAPELEDVRTRATVLPYGVDVDHFARRPALADEIRSRYPGPLVVFLGLLRHYKGVHVLVEAMCDVEATLLVCGEGPERGGVEAAVRRLGVGDRVVFLGRVEEGERVAYLHAADVFVLPSVSRGEAFGIALLEAMAAGTPVVSTELGTGTSWVNVHGETGLVVRARDARALARAIASLLDDDERRAAMGRAAQLRVREHFTQEQMFEGLRRVYQAR